jgi:hypothetical protein
MEFDMQKDVQETIHAQSHYWLFTSWVIRPMTLAVADWVRRAWINLSSLIICSLFCRAGLVVVSSSNFGQLENEDCYNKDSRDCSDAPIMKELVENFP